MINEIKKSIKSSIDVKNSLLNQDNVLVNINKCVEIIINCYNNGNKVLFCGNGGSAADAQHLSAELSGRFKIDREPLDAEALHVNSSYITAVANDYGYDKIFSRLIKAKGKNGDVLIGLSTSGNSKNVVEAFLIAKKMGLVTVAMTGNTNNQLAEISDIIIMVPSIDTANIQESHIMIGHIICDLVEKNIFYNGEK